MRNEPSEEKIVDQIGQISQPISAKSAQHRLKSGQSWLIPDGERKKGGILSNIGRDRPNGVPILDTQPWPTCRARTLSPMQRWIVRRDPGTHNWPTSVEHARPTLPISGRFRAEFARCGAGIDHPGGETIFTPRRALNAGHALRLASQPAAPAPRGELQITCSMRRGDAPRAWRAAIASKTSSSKMDCCTSRACQPPRFQSARCSRDRGGGQRSVPTLAPCSCKIARPCAPHGADAPMGGDRPRASRCGQRFAARGTPRRPEERSAAEAGRGAESLVFAPRPGVPAHHGVAASHKPLCRRSP